MKDMGGGYLSGREKTSAVQASARDAQPSLTSEQEQKKPRWLRVSFYSGGESKERKKLVNMENQLRGKVLKNLCQRGKEERKQSEPHQRLLLLEFGLKSLFGGRFVRGS